MRTPVLGGFVTLLACAAIPAGAQPAAGGAENPEDVVRRLYDLVSWEAGGSPDWEAVRAAFLPEAVVILRYRELTRFSVEAFVQDFIDFAERSDAGTQGFTETVVSAKSWVYADIAHVVVVYEARIRGADRPPTRGVDSWSLVRLDDAWRVASVVNELLRPDAPTLPGFPE